MKKLIYFLLISSFAFFFLACNLTPINYEAKFPGSAAPVAPAPVTAPAPVPAVEPEVVAPVPVAPPPVASAPLAVTQLKGYYIKNSVSLPQNINFYVLDSDKRFNDTLAKSNIATAIQNVDLKNYIVVVLASNRSALPADIAVWGASYTGSEIEINYFAQQPVAASVGYLSVSNKIIMIERRRPITNVRFKDASGKITAVVPFGDRNANSPKSTDDLLNNFTGVFQGIASSANNQTISVRLTLNADYTYSFNQVYSNDPSRVFTVSGDWAPTDDLSTIVLNFKSPAAEQTRFYFVDKNTLQKMNAFGEINSTESYKLIR